MQVKISPILSGIDNKPTIKKQINGDPIISVFQHMSNFIMAIHTIGNRIIVADIQESFHFVRYKRQENQLIVFADDTNSRWITSSCLLDYNTVAGADKFGNIVVVSNVYWIITLWQGPTSLATLLW